MRDDDDLYGAEYQMHHAEKELWKVNDCMREVTFLNRLASWILRHYGNVNVAQRLNVIAIKKVVK